ncbi:MAG: YdiU family protein [Tissierellia bacterium]|nr:YdiU family protein [Tissierellia bacterium]
MKNTGWNFDNTYEKLPSSFYRKVQLSPVVSPTLVLLNKKLAKELGLDPQLLKNMEGLSILSGSQLPEGGSSISQAYMGHQFGHLTMLGDGRALLIGEQITPEGKRYDLQYKGSGPTPFSRGGDGRAILGPMLREYIIGEAMHNLGIASSRTLSVSLTGQKIFRGSLKKGAILVRVAASHIRIGTFVYAAHQKNTEDLKALADYTIDRLFPEIKNSQEPYLDFYKKVITLQAQLVAKWMLVGFIHGVMNSDNVAISGETMDYGPCAFMDIYRAITVFSSIDSYGRYSYENQPSIGMWNLTRLGETLIPIIDREENLAVEKLKSALEEYPKIYNQAYYTGLGEKLGLVGLEPESDKFLDELLQLLEKNKLDYTNTFLDLTFKNFEKPVYTSKEFLAWKEKWQELLKKQSKSIEEVEDIMKKHNPAIIPRNYWVEKAIEKADKGEYELLFDLLKALEDPYAHNEHQKKYSIVPENMNYVTFCGT